MSELPEGWKKLYGPGTKRHYYRQGETSSVCGHDGRTRKTPMYDHRYKDAKNCELCETIKETIDEVP